MIRTSLCLLLLLGGCEPQPRPEGPPRGLVRFGFPVAQPELIHQLVGVDHDPVDQTGVLGGAICTSYDGRPFPWCYDGHRGSDYMLEGGFSTMDAGSAEVIAAADGVVVDVEDGHYDRCHAEGDGVSCDGHEKIANRVEVNHGYGIIGLYVHLLKDSPTVEIGDEVRCGDLLGIIGSSGNSSAPHLHFQVEDADGVVIDPYAGDYSQEATWWDEQGPSTGLPGPGCTDD